MSRAVIVGGAGIGDYKRIRHELREDDFLIFCDGGLRHREALGMSPSLIIGDFDSHPLPEIKKQESEFEFTEPAAYGQRIRHAHTADGTEVIILPHMKDWTDSVYAAKEVAARGFDSLLLIGASGGRPDHYFANISILNMPELSKADTWIMDDCSKMCLLTAGKSLRIDDSGKYFSLIAFDGPARGVTVRGALYPLREAEITAEDPYAVSNEVLPGGMAEVTLREGKLLVILID